MTHFDLGASTPLDETRPGLEFEEGIAPLVQDVGCRLYVWSLERLDNRLMQGRDRAQRKVVGLRSRTLVTSFGEATTRRRLYRDANEDERYVVLLDRALGWSRNSRLSPRMKQIGVVLSTVGDPYPELDRARRFRVFGVSAGKPA